MLKQEIISTLLTITLFHDSSAEARAFEARIKKLANPRRIKRVKKGGLALMIGKGGGNYAHRSVETIDEILNTEEMMQKAYLLFHGVAA
jgi:hypothetical protein